MTSGLMRLVLLAVLAFGLLGIATVQPPARTTAAASSGFSFQWNGKPAAPQPWRPGSTSDWDLAVHDRDVVNGRTPFPTATAQHGADCSAAPNTHSVSSAADSVFICNNHLMTVLNAGGYGEIEMAPSRLADWSQGTTSITFSASTFRTSPRDWFDLYVMPFQENVLLPGELDVDLLGRPRDAIHVDMGLKYPTTFVGELISNFNQNDITTGGASVEDTLSAAALLPSATARTRFELDISRTHVRFGMPDYNNWWVDRDVPSLGFTQGVVQLGHHSYTPDKECSPTPGVLSCTGNTWHWSDFSISSTIPFTMLRPDTPWDLSDGQDRVQFQLPAPAPSSSFLRMAAIGPVKYSADGGRTWITPQVQPTDRNTSGAYQDAVFNSYWTPFPAGATTIMFTGQDWYGGPWMVNDPSVWSGTAVNAPAGNSTSATPTAPPAPPAGTPAPLAAPPPVQAAPAPVEGPRPGGQTQSWPDGESHDRSPGKQGNRSRPQTGWDERLPDPLRLIAARREVSGTVLPLAGLLIAIVVASVSIALCRMRLRRTWVRRR